MASVLEISTINTNKPPLRWQLRGKSEQLPCLRDVASPGRSLPSAVFANFNGLLSFNTYFFPVKEFSLVSLVSFILLCFLFLYVFLGIFQIFIYFALFIYFCELVKITLTQVYKPSTGKLYVYILEFQKLIYKIFDYLK